MRLDWIDRVQSAYASACQALLLKYSFMKTVQHIDEFNVLIIGT